MGSTLPHNGHKPYLNINSFTKQDNPIYPTVSKILGYKQTDRQTCVFKCKDFLLIYLFVSIRNRWIRTSSNPYEKIMSSIVLYLQIKKCTIIRLKPAFLAPRCRRFCSYNCTFYICRKPFIIHCKKNYSSMALKPINIR